MGVWIMSIVGVVVIGVLVDILLPEGEINKYIKGVFAIIVIAVIVAPLPALAGGKLDLDSLAGGDFGADKEFVEDVDDRRGEQIAENVKLYLELNEKLEVESVAVEKKEDSYTVTVIMRETPDLSIKRKVAVIAGVDENNVIFKEIK